ncbi:hypothetical protein DRQ09_07000, partial [candidate division KSB1 bacterium]
NFTISIEKSNQVKNFFKDKIKFDFSKLIEAKKGKIEFRKSIGKTEKAINMFLEDILNNDDLIFTIYKIKCIDEATSKSGIPLFYNHIINEVILSTSIIKNAEFNIAMKFNIDDMKNIANAALLHNVKGIETKGKYTQYKPEERKKRYILENEKSYEVAECLSMNKEVIKCIKLCSNYYKGNKEVIKKGEDKATVYANVVLVADIMDEKISGLFEEPVKPWNAADYLYVLAENGELQKGYVNALVKSLKLDNLFDFYFEIERLTKMCVFKTSARPYPMLGFKSPVLFLCKDNRRNCKEYGASIKSVHVFKENSGLKPGVYGRCNLLSDKLLKFYETYYKEIKEDIILTQREKKEENNNSNI